jgi:hypothetical protein
LAHQKRIGILAEIQGVRDCLQEIPDFQLEIRWTFTSSFIPFVSIMAPSDTFKLTKIGDQLRLDFALVGLKGFSVKKRKCS